MGVYVATATAGPYPTIDECNQALPAEIDRAVTDYAEKEFQPVVDQPIKLDREVIKDHLIAQQYHGEGQHILRPDAARARAAGIRQPGAGGNRGAMANAGRFSTAYSHRACGWNLFPRSRRSLTFPLAKMEASHAIEPSLM